jgi:hypothetical protein
VKKLPAITTTLTNPTVKAAIDLRPSAPSAGAA